MASSFTPAIPQIAKEFNTTGSVVTCVSPPSTSSAISLINYSQSSSHFVDLHNIRGEPILGNLLRILYVISLSQNYRSYLLLPSDGRRAIYIAGLLVLCAGSAGVIFAKNVPQLLATRIVQAFGASSGFSVGIAVIGDLYKVEERGTATGIFFGVCPGHYSTQLHY